MRYSRTSCATQPAVELTAGPLATRPQGGVLIVSLAVAGLMLVATAAEGWRMPVLLVLGGLLGATLYLTAFGFTSAYRNFVVHRDVAGMRAQIVMLALASLLFAPVLSAGSVFGHAVTGAVAPVGLQVAAGALMFGIGMQLAGGCGSGTLYTAGGGSPRMIVVLIAFCAGSFWATLHMGSWQRLPSWGEFVLGDMLGWPAALIVQFAVLAAAWKLPERLLRKQNDNPPGLLRALARDWLLLLGAVLLAVLNFLVLIVAGHPWTITWAFALWGAKTAQFIGWEPGADGFWSGDFQSAALSSGIFQDVTSVTDIGIMIGALAAASLAGRFAPTFRIPLRSLIAATAGGLLMGYGARIAYGCNVGAFFSGVASTSVHGWLWIAAALGGTWFGVRLRPWFGLKN